jgi:putative NADPH-quinone reductase
MKGVSPLSESKMNIIVIVAHPSRQSFNRAIAETAAGALRNNGHHVIFHDLYEEKFDPVLPNDEIPKGAVSNKRIETYCTELSTADGIVIVHPNWWGQPPAILKGWIDRVIRPGVAYEFLEGDNGQGVPVGLLKAKAAIVFNTSNTLHEREMNVFGDPLETIWKNCIFDLCGVKNFYRKMFGIIVTSTLNERKEWLEEVRETVNRYFPG